jgi:hypothetical protein
VDRINTRGSRELYASISFSAPCGLLQSCKTEETESQQAAVISFNSGLSWRIPVYDDISEGIRSICQAVNQLSQPLIVPNEP